MGAARTAPGHRAAWDGPHRARREAAPGSVRAPTADDRRDRTTSRGRRRDSVTCRRAYLWRSRRTPAWRAGRAHPRRPYWRKFFARRSSPTDERLHVSDSGVDEPTSHLPPPSLRTSQQRSERVKLRRALSFLGMTLVLPGSAQIAAGNKRVGRIAIWTWISLWALLLLLGVGALVWRVGRRRAVHQLHRADGAADPARRPRSRLGTAVHRRLAAVPAAGAGPSPSAGLRGDERGAGAGRGRRPGGLGLDRVVSAEPDDVGVRRRRRDQGAGRPLQHPAARRGRREGPHRAPTRQPDRGQHRRRDRPDGADQPAAQHGGRALPGELADAQEVPEGLRLQGPLLHAERRLHLRQHASGHLSRQRQGPRRAGHQGSGRGRDRAEDQLLRDGRHEGLRGPGRRRRRDPDRRQPTDPDRWRPRQALRLRREGQEPAARRSLGPVVRPVAVRLRPTTTGWLGRSA